MKNLSRQLTLTEYQMKELVELTTAERDSIALVIPSITIMPRTDFPGHYDLTPGSWVGGVDLGTLSIEIRPKIPMDHLLFLISYSLYRRKWRESSFLAVQETHVVEAVIAGFLGQFRRALAWGLLRGYRNREDLLTTVRGRIQFDDQLRDYFGRFPPVAVSYDEFTEDIEENRLLKAAIDRLSRMRVRSETLRRALAAGNATLVNVSLIPYDPRRLPHIAYTRLNEHYRPALEMAKLILQSASFDLRHGRQRTTAFLVDMNKVFEDFVVAALRDALNLSTFAFPQGASGRTMRLDREGRIVLEPDISWWKGDTCVFVGDVKYKRTQGTDAFNADFYQMLAYVVAANLPGGLLIYAAGEAQPGPYEVVHLGKRLEVVTLSPSGSPEQILQEIRALAHRIQHMRALAEAKEFEVAILARTAGIHTSAGRAANPTP